MPWGGCGRAAPSMCGCDRAAPRKCLLGADQCVDGPGWELHSRAVAPPASSSSSPSSSCSACGPRSRVSARSPPLRVWGHRPSTRPSARLQALTAGRRTWSEPFVLKYHSCPPQGCNALNIYLGSLVHASELCSLVRPLVCMGGKFQESRQHRRQNRRFSGTTAGPASQY